MRCCPASGGTLRLRRQQPPEDSGENAVAGMLAVGAARSSWHARAVELTLAVEAVGLVEAEQPLTRLRHSAAPPLHL